MVVSEYYLTPVLDISKIPSIISKLTVSIPKNLDYNSIVFRGMSGALIAPILAYNLKKKLIAIRKPSERTENKIPVIGDIDLDVKYIIIDDLIDSGNTVIEIINDMDQLLSMSHFAPLTVKCKGVFLYNQSFAPLGWTCKTELVRTVFNRNIPVNFVYGCGAVWTSRGLYTLCQQYENGGI